MYSVQCTVVTTVARLLVYSERLSSTHPRTLGYRAFWGTSVAGWRWTAALEAKHQFSRSRDSWVVLFFSHTTHDIFRVFANGKPHGLTNLDWIHTINQTAPPLSVAHARTCTHAHTAARQLEPQINSRPLRLQSTIAALSTIVALHHQTSLGRRPQN